MGTFGHRGGASRPLPGRGPPRNLPAATLLRRCAGEREIRLDQGRRRDGLLEGLEVGGGAGPARLTPSSTATATGWSRSRSSSTISARSAGPVGRSTSSSRRRPDTTWYDMAPAERHATGACSGRPGGASPPTRSTAPPPWSRACSTSGSTTSASTSPCSTPRSGSSTSANPDEEIRRGGRARRQPDERRDVRARIARPHHAGRGGARAHARRRPSRRRPTPCASSGSRCVMIANHVRRPVPGVRARGRADPDARRACTSTRSASRAPTTTTRSGSAALELQGGGDRALRQHGLARARVGATASPTTTSATSPTPATPSPRRSSSAASPTASPQLRFAFLEGGVGWACNLVTDLVGHWERRRRAAMESADAAHEPRPGRAGAACSAQYGGRVYEDKMDEIFRCINLAEPFKTRRGADRARLPAGAFDDFAAVPVQSAEELRRHFAERFYFGCEADDPMTAWAFDRHGNHRLQPDLQLRRRPLRRGRHDARCWRRPGSWSSTG